MGRRGGGGGGKKEEEKRRRIKEERKYINNVNICRKKQFASDISENIYVL
jgi:hypothetical protein